MKYIYRSFPYAVIAFLFAYLNNHHWFTQVLCFSAGGITGVFLEAFKEASAESIKTHKPVGKKDSRRLANTTGHPFAKAVGSHKYNSRGNLDAKEDINSVESLEGSCKEKQVKQPTTSGLSKDTKEEGKGGK